jgi:hypothetical protein
LCATTVPTYDRGGSSEDPPRHLHAATKQWWVAVLQEHRLGQHELRTLQVAAEAWDRKEQAREALIKAGALSYTDSRGMRRALPEVQIERDARIAFLRAMRELNLGIESPDHNKNAVGISWRDLEDRAQAAKIDHPEHFEE